MTDPHRVICGLNFNTYLALFLCVHHISRSEVPCQSALCEALFETTKVTYPPQDRIVINVIARNDQAMLVFTCNV